MDRRSFISAITSFATIPNITYANENKVLRIGLNGLSSQKGNPFYNVQTPTILLTGGIFDGLTRMNKDGSLAPWLATSWKLIDDLTWRFYLRKDVVL